jgi:hypothetical protein
MCTILNSVHPSGFAENEAREVFHMINTDGGEGVGMDEFKTWWMNCQRQENARRRPPLKLTGEALIENLKRMLTVLKRENMTEIAEVFARYLAEVSWLFG